MGKISTRNKGKSKKYKKERKKNYRKSNETEREAGEEITKADEVEDIGETGKGRAGLKILEELERKEKVKEGNNDTYTMTKTRFWKGKGQEINDRTDSK